MLFIALVNDTVICFQRFSYILMKVFIHEKKVTTTITKFDKQKHRRNCVCLRSVRRIGVCQFGFFIVIIGAHMRRTPKTISSQIACTWIKCRCRYISFFDPNAF